MSPDTDASQADSPDSRAEPDVELSGFWNALLARWWVIVIGLVVGGVIGYLVSLGGGKVFQAKATIYLGEPLNQNSSAQVLGPGSNPSIVSQIVKNTSTINLVAAQVGVQPGKLRRGTASSAVANGGTSAKNAQTALVTITVRGPWKRPAADAANKFADIVVDQVSRYADAKIALLQSQSDAAKQQLDALDSAISQYQSAATNQSLTPAERLAAVGLLNAAVAQRGDLVAAKTQTDLQLELAKNVEKGQVVTRAAASQISARSRRSSTIVGAAIGLLLGIAVALLWEPVRRRARRSRADGQPAT